MRKPKEDPSNCWPWKLSIKDNTTQASLPRVKGFRMTSDEEEKQIPVPPPTAREVPQSPDSPHCQILPDLWNGLGCPNCSLSNNVQERLGFIPYTVWIEFPSFGRVREPRSTGPGHTAAFGLSARDCSLVYCIYQYSCWEKRILCPDWG